MNCIFLFSLIGAAFAGHVPVVPVVSNYEVVGTPVGVQRTEVTTPSLIHPYGGAYPTTFGTYPYVGTVGTPIDVQRSDVVQPQIVDYTGVTPKFVGVPHVGTVGTPVDQLQRTEASLVPVYTPQYYYGTHPQTYTTSQLPAVHKTLYTTTTHSQYAPLYGQQYNNLYSGAPVVQYYPY